jgi:predicted PurR-regulated permease PerM
MDQKQSFNFNADFLGGFTTMFMKLVFVIIAVYLFVLILNFLRDKFINKATDTKKDNISVLITILNKLFFVSGFGFILGILCNSCLVRYQITTAVSDQ